jgi:large subunit ribosomal protein L1
VTPDVVKAINEFKGGMVEYRTDRFANVHVPIGKVSFDDAALLTNLRALVGELERVKPASAKGKYVKKVVVSSTMGPGVRIEPAGITGSDA